MSYDFPLSWEQISGVNSDPERTLQGNISHRRAVRTPFDIFVGAASCVGTGVTAAGGTLQPLELYIPILQLDMHPGKITPHAGERLWSRFVQAITRLGWRLLQHEEPARL